MSVPPINQHPPQAAPPQPAGPAAPQQFATAAMGLVKVYGSGPSAVQALGGVNAAFPRGQFSAIMGPSGSGKSTLMHCLAGLDLATHGHVTLGELTLTGMPDKQLTQVRRDRIGFIFQSFNLLPTLSAEQNILLPLQLAGRGPDQQWFRTITQALGIAERLRHRPSELSGGQQQRVAVARALVTRPEVVFADEPTGALDSKSGTNLLTFLRQSVNQFGQTVVMVTHDPVAASYADSVTLLADGQIAGRIQRPTPDSVLNALRGLGG